MSVSSIASLLIGLISLVLAFVLEGGHIGSLFQYTAAMIVFGGTIGAVGLSFPMKDLKRIPYILKTAFTEKKDNLIDLINYFKEISMKSRKEGLLSLEDEIAKATDLEPLVKKGLQLVIDGVEPESVRKILENEILLKYERNKNGIAIFEAAGGFAPTMGIIGTVMGLVHVLGSLENPQELGPKIAVAFIATLYGVSSANLLWLPIANKLKAINKIDNLRNELIIEAVSSIQEGINPNILQERLISFCDESDLIKFRNSDKANEDR